MVAGAIPFPAAVIVDAFALGALEEEPTYGGRGELGVVWQVRTDQGRWAVKQLLEPADASTGEDVGFQLAALADGVPLPRPVLTPAGTTVVVGPDGRGYRVYEWVDFDDGGRVGNATAGALLARIHGVGWPTASIDPWFAEPVPDDHWASVVRAARDACPSWLELLERQVDAIREATATRRARPPQPLVRCHLDFNPDNVLLDRSAQPWVIDWENSGGAVPTHELAQAIFEFAADEPRAVRQFVNGYREGGGECELRDLEDLSMAFTVQANLIAFYASRALTGTDEDRERSNSRLETILNNLLTLEFAQRILDATTS